MATENPWRARRIQAELEELGISAMDFLVIPTASFKLLYVWFAVWFAIGHKPREILRVNVTSHPTVAWVVQQVREALPDEPSIRFLIHDNDSIFSDRVDQSIACFGIDGKRTRPGSPWQNRTAERWVGTLKRDLLDHVIVLDEPHLRRILREHVEYYNTERVHTVIRDAPKGRVVEPKPSRSAEIAARPRLGGLHHVYEWQAAAWSKDLRDPRELLPLVCREPLGS